jgi:hypothetical protein
VALILCGCDALRQALRRILRQRSNPGKGRAMPLKAAMAP